MNQIDRRSQLIFQQAPIEPLDDGDNLTIQQKALRVFDYRLHKYFKTIDKRYWASFDDLTRQISICILDFQNQHKNQQDFKLSALCAATRILEQNTTNRNGLAYFPNFYHQDNELKIVRKYLQTTLSILQKNFEIIKLPNDHPIFPHSIRNLKKNQQVIQEIFGQIQFKEKYLDEYLEKVELWAVQDLSKENIYGISHYKGLKLYIDAELVKNAGIQEEITKFNQPIDFESLSAYLKLLVTFEHESTHNILRFVIKNKRFCFISPKYHSHLKYNGKPIESGFIYENWAYNIIPQFEGPFCLNHMKK